MTFRPLNEYITVRPDPLHEKVGALFVPDVDRFHHQGDGVLTAGTVVAVGKGDLILKGPDAGGYSPVECQAGDRILYPRHELVSKIAGGLHVIHQQHVFGILEEDFGTPFKFTDPELERSLKEFGERYGATAPSPGIEELEP